MTNDELIAALEKATGPDRELDHEIVVPEGWRLQDIMLIRLTHTNARTYQMLMEN